MHRPSPRRRANGGYSSFCRLLAGIAGLTPALGAIAPCAQAQAAAPRSLVAEVAVEHYLEVAPQSVRIERDPISGDLHYLTFQGDVYQILSPADGQPRDSLIATAEDHGVTRLQGIVFADSTLFLVGNVAVNEGKGTRGRMMAGKLEPNGTRSWSVVFMTDEIGSTRTTFDHGFNGITLSPDRRYLFVNSGARTDHGEVQDNDGAYPNSRDEPLTASIFRIPAEARDVHLRNDLADLEQRGFVYARGLRNAYDLAFSPNGHLFAVSNSSDYDHPEDMFWIREGHHYGFPWVMGNVDNPQQYPDFTADPEADPFLNHRSHAMVMGYFRHDPDFPKRPSDLVITPPVANVGPDADEYRDPETGTVRDGSESRVAIGTFTAHSSPLGLFFDADSVLAPPYRGDGFVLRWTLGSNSGLMGPISPLGSDLLHLRLLYSPGFDNYIVQTTRIADGFRGPVDAELVGNEVYVIEYGRSGNVWKLTFPSAPRASVGAGPPPSGAKCGSALGGAGAE